MEHLQHEDYLMHYGVKGMRWNHRQAIDGANGLKWGVKRYPQPTTQTKTVSSGKSMSEYLNERNGERINQLRVSNVQATRAHSLGKDYVEKTKHKTFSMRVKDFVKKSVNFGKNVVRKLFSLFSK